MPSKNSVQVLIDGRVYTLSGYEDEDYLNRVAVYINNKLLELKQEESFRRQTKDVQNTLVYLNIADDYYKIKRRTDELGLELEEKSREIYELKHELIETQLKLEETEKELENLKRKTSEQEKNIVKLETELSSEQKKYK